MASPLLSRQPHLIYFCLPLANMEEATQVMINEALVQLVLVRLPFVRSEVATNVELPFGSYGDGIVCSLYTFLPPA